MFPVDILLRCHGHGLLCPGDVSEASIDILSIIQGAVVANWERDIKICIAFRCAFTFCGLKFMFKKPNNTFLLNLNDHVQGMNAEDEVSWKAEIYEQGYNLAKNNVST